MTRAVLQWPGRRGTRAGWTNDERAELYRVEHALTQAAVRVETDCGLSDEGDPWFVFCRPDGQVVVHIARIDGLYHLHCLMLPQPLKSPSFAALARTYVATLPQPQCRQRSGAVVAHPSALLSLLVAAAIISVDALERHPASAHELSAARPTEQPQRPGPAKPDAKDGAHEAFAKTLAAAVWRDRAEEGGAWRLVEQAALAFTALGAATRDSAVNPTAAAGALAADPTTAQVDATNTGGATVENHAQPEPAPPAAVIGGPVAPLATPQTPGASLAPLGKTQIIDASPESGNGAAYRAPAAPDFARSPGAAGVPALPGEGALLTPAARELSVTLVGAAQSIALTAGEVWSLVVSGRGDLTLLNAGAVGSIDVAARASADLTLIYEATTPAPAWQTLTLGGATDLSLVAVPAEARPVRLVVDSEGTHGNELSIGSSQPADFNLRVVGSQNLTLKESAATFEASRLDASKLTGALEVGVDFSTSGHAATNLSLASGNFIVQPQDSIALENLKSHATIDIGVDLNSAIFGFEHAAASPALTLDLGPAVGDAPLSLGLIEAAGARDLSIVSSGGDNGVQTIFDPALAQLQLSGAGALEIGAIQGLRAGAGQGLAIDAADLGGFLTLNVGAIAGPAAGGQSISITLGAGGGAITDMAAGAAVALTIGGGPATFYLADGVTLVSIAGLKAADQVFIGAATVSDTFVNALSESASKQSVLDASSLTGAASAAAALAGATNAHQAVLFSYHGDSYVFIDAAGGHVFDPSLDAIIKLVGAAPTSDLAGVFHSA
jgi:hypothetical protein